MKKAKLEKSPWVTVKKKPGPKKVEKSFDETKKLQLAESHESSAIMAKSENSMSDLGVLFYDLPLRLLPILRLKSPILRF